MNVEKMRAGKQIADMLEQYDDPAGRVIRDLLIAHREALIELGRWPCSCEHLGSSHSRIQLQYVPHTKYADGRTLACTVNNCPCPRYRPQTLEETK